MPSVKELLFCLIMFVAHHCGHGLQIRAIVALTFPSDQVADVLGVSLDYLAGEEDKEEVLDNEAVKRIKEIQKLPLSEKEKIYSVVDALIRDHKTKKAYS